MALKFLSMFVIARRKETLPTQRVPSCLPSSSLAVVSTTQAYMSSMKPAKSKDSALFVDSQEVLVDTHLTVTESETFVEPSSTDEDEKFSDERE